METIERGQFNTELFENGQNSEELSVRLMRKPTTLDGIVQIITQIVVLTIIAETMPKSQKSIVGISETLLTPLTYFPVCSLNIAGFQTTLRNET